MGNRLDERIKALNLLKASSLKNKQPLIKTLESEIERLKKK